MIVSFIVVLALSALLIFLYINNASSLGMIAVPNKRSEHKKSMPCGAGIAFISALFIGVVITVEQDIYSSYSLSIVAVMLVFFLGVYDDYKHTSSSLKFLLIIIASLLVCLDGLLIPTMGRYFSYDIPLLWASIPVTVIAIVGFTNALNLVDGLDGLAASISLIVFAALAYIGHVFHDNFLFMLSTLLFSTLTAFIYFNWNPAKIFMGDSGSLTIGFIISIMFIKALDYIDPISALYITAVPIFDTLSVMIRRKRNRVSMLKADRNHLHHIVLANVKGNVRLAVSLIAVLQLAFTLLGILFALNHVAQEITLPLFLISLGMFYWVSERLYQKVKPSLVVEASAG